MEKKAEAYAKYNKAAVAEMMIKVLPDIAGKLQNRSVRLTRSQSLEVAKAAAMVWIRLPEMCRWSWQKSLKA